MSDVSDMWMRCCVTESNLDPCTLIESFLDPCSSGEFYLDLCTLRECD